MIPKNRAGIASDPRRGTRKGKAARQARHGYIADPRLTEHVEGPGFGNLGIFQPVAEVIHGVRENPRLSCTALPIRPLSRF